MPLRFTFLVNTLQEGWGIPERALNLGKELHHLGQHVHFVTLRKNRILDEFGADTTELRFLKRPFPIFIASSKIFKPFSFFILLKHLARSKPDFIFVDYTPLDWYAIKAKPFLGHKTIYTYHGVADPSFYEGREKDIRIKNKNIIHENARQADLVVAVSQFAKDALTQDNIPSIVIPNGVDINLFSPDKQIKNLTKSGPILLFVGRYTEHKGMLLLLQSFKSVLKKNPDVILLSFGHFESPPYVKKIRAFIREHSLQNNVYLLGPLQGDMRAYIYNCADIFVSGATNETFGMTFLEAQACGVPCVGFNASSIPEVIIHQETGFLAESGNIEDHAKCILKLLHNKSLRQSMGENARKNAHLFQWEIIAQKILQTCNNLKEGSTS